MHAPRGRRFAVLTRPDAPPVGKLLFLHPFAEEMNRSRRMVALAAQMFASHGWIVLQLDHLGSGDSDGDLGDVRWQDWLDDVASGWNWLQGTASDGPTVLWALRAGSLIAADWMRQTQMDVPLLLWQPILSGRQYLTQFLRLKASSAMLDASITKTSVTEMRRELASGESVEIIGYRLPADVAARMEMASLELPSGYSSPVAVFEVASGDPTPLTPALGEFARLLDAGGTPVSVEVVRGASFWQSQEIEIAPGLATRSISALQRLLNR